MDEAKIRQIAREEVQKAQMSSFTGRSHINSGVPYVAPHTHDGVNNLQVNQKNIIPNVGFAGSIEFDNTAIYTLNFSAINPTTVLFNGVAKNSTVHALVNGSAYLSKAWAFQPLNNRSVQAGGTPYPIGGIPIQGCASLIVDNGDIGNTVGRVNSNNLVFVEDHNNITTALLSIILLNNTSMQLNVTLASGWIIVGQFLIY